MNFLTRHVLSAYQPQKKSLTERVTAPVRASKGWQAVKRIVAKVIVAQDDLKKAGPLPESVDLVLASAVSTKSAVGGDFVCEQAFDDYLVLLNAFRVAQDGSSDCPTMALDAARKYQFWAQATVPAYRRSLASPVSSRKGSANSTGTTSTTPAIKGSPDTVKSLVIQTPATGFSSTKAWLVSGGPGVEVGQKTTGGIPMGEPFRWEATEDYFETGMGTSSSAGSNPNVGKVSLLAFLKEPLPTSFVNEPKSLFALDPAFDTDEVSIPSLAQGSISERQMFLTSTGAPHTGTEDDAKTQLPLPPLEVLMAWHAHLMKPFQYGIDMKEQYRHLDGVAFPLRAAAEAIRQGTLPLQCEDTPEERSYLVRSGCLDEIELSNLIRAQGTFIGHVEKAGYLKPDLINEKPHVALAANVRYHGWIELLGAEDDFVRLEPALDIEITWRCHRLNHRIYNLDTLGRADDRYWNTMRNHNGIWTRTIDDDLYLPRTKFLWKQRFGVDY